MSSNHIQPLASDRRDEPSGHNAPSAGSSSAAIVAATALDGLNAHENSTIDAGAADTAHAAASRVGSDLSCVPGSPTVAAQYSAVESAHLTHSPESLPVTRESSLHLQTDLSHPAYGYTTPPASSTRRPALSLRNQSSAQSLRPVSRTPSLKTGIYGAFGSASAASSAVASPVISAMGDLTPLPSPLLASDSPGPWKRRMSRETTVTPPTSAPLEASEHTGQAASSRKGYAGLASCPTPADGACEQQDNRLAQPKQQHTRNRSISEYIPDPMLVPKRMSTVSGIRVKPDLQNVAEGRLRREPHLSEARGLTPVEKPPTPPPSESSLSTTDLSLTAASTTSTSSKQARAEFFEARGRYDQKRRRWRALRVLGQGTFSQVYLATSQTSSSSCSSDEDCSTSAPVSTHEQPATPERRSLVAVKVCEHGPRGGASEDRIEMSLKRELQIMQSVRHPSLVHLKAWSIEPTRAILVLSYYPGGDLFDVAARHRSLLTPCLIRRIFSELVGAVTYLHAQNIVHRDIKLENVLVNLPPSELSPETDWTTYPYSVATLTDLGLSRRIAPDEKLETRCGSDDYAAPEVIMGQPYDGRATDAWSLGVLLYALLESRLPFDPPPAAGPQGADHAMQVRMRSRTSHRIARVEWRWFEYGAGEGEDGEGDHEADLAKFEAKGLLGAMEVVEGLLKRARSRWPLNKVAEVEWVAKGVCVEGGIRFRDEEEGEEV
ncbi:kinase-like domain-containing protein [Corynascus novoguineensis]|uniref:Kinase-like domain-containing protein n=1 Tax=Corynascus novoguineensis TaxID=1126955 RepID=A0AAN7CYU1_9PEZI|nr:kinase-like domain-containing protein [Corynascus novoguineensis]